MITDTPYFDTKTLLPESEIVKVAAVRMFREIEEIESAEQLHLAMLKECPDCCLESLYAMNPYELYIHALRRM